MNYARVLAKVHDVARTHLGAGRVADYIPALSTVDAGQFGLAVATCAGAVHGVGDWQTPFSIQSISKVFTLALAVAREGEAIWRRVGREPSGTPFDSLIQLENDDGVPRNPFINAGALVVTDRLLTLTGNPSGELRAFLRQASGNPHIDLDVDVAASEMAHAHRNAALAHVLAGCGTIDNPVETLLQHYVRQCSLSMSCADIARAASFLARHGVLADGSRLVSPSSAKRINAVMLTCGTYDESGEFACRVGLPGKSGVGGGILAIVPGRCTLCVWSPGLGPKGNSVAGVAALAAFTSLTGWSVF